MSLESNLAKLPPFCYSILLSTHEFISIKRGVSGYFRVPDKNFHSNKDLRELVDKLNCQLGVTKAQEQAMTFGSMFGWATPGADPDRYLDIYPEKETPVKKISTPIQEDSFVFDDEICVNDENLEVIDGYLWATEPLIDRLKEQLYHLVNKDYINALDNPNFYALYQPHSGEIKITGTCYTPPLKTQWNLDIPLTADERSTLCNKMNEYCEAEYGLNCKLYLDDIRESEGLIPFDLDAQLRIAKKRSENTKKTEAEKSKKVEKNYIF